MDKGSALTLNLWKDYNKTMKNFNYNNLKNYGQFNTILEPLNNKGWGKIITAAIIPT